MSFYRLICFGNRNDTGCCFLDFRKLRIFFTHVYTVSGIQGRKCPKQVGLQQIFPKQLKYTVYDTLTKKGDENAKRAFRFQGKRLDRVNREIMAAGISSKYDVLTTQINRLIEKTWCKKGGDILTLCLII